MDGGMVMGGFPRPGRALKAVLITLFAVSVAGAVIFNWAPGGATGARILSWFMCDLNLVLVRPWTLLTSGLITSPTEVTHVLYALIGIYFLGSSLEERWGGTRFVRFLLVSVAAGNLLSLLLHLVVPESAGAIFHRSLLFGPGAAIAATAIAWSREHAHSQVRLFFVLPVTGKVLFWVTIGFCVLGLIYYQSTPEGAFSPFGGVLAGLLLSGSPSPVRSAWLRLKLAFLRRKGPTLSAESIAGLDRPKAKRPAKVGGPTLRVVKGGADDDLKNRKPPTDKRYLN